MTYALKVLGVFLLWNIGIGFFLLVAPPAVGLPLALLLAAALLWGYLLRAPAGTDPARRWADLRLRPLQGPALTWSLAGVPVMIVLAWAIGDVYTRFVPVPVESLNPFGDVLDTSLGRLSISIFAVAVAPLVEEFVFRGLIQRRMERDFGAPLGIAIAAGLFALVHLLPWVLPLHFLLGLIFGLSVWATRSIWTGVLLHAGNNAAAMLGFGLGGESPDPTSTVWETGITADLWVSLTVLLVSLLAAALVGARLLHAGRSHLALRTARDSV
jgi:uncharacterized protein